MSHHTEATAFQIRAARANDAEAIAALARQLLEYEQGLHQGMGSLTGWAASAAELRKQLLRPNTHFLVAESDTGLIGYIKLTLHGRQLSRQELGTVRWLVDRLEQAARRTVNVLLRRPRPNVEIVGGYIAGIFVLPSARRSRAGHALITAAENWFRTQGVSACELHVLYTNETARSFWEREGYTPLTLGMRKEL